MRKFLTFCILFLTMTSAFAQSDVKPVRSGNRKFKSGNFRKAELDYRRAIVEDSTSVAATYDLASSLYRQNDFDGAGKTLSKIGDEALDASRHSAKIHFNRGDVALQKKDYATAVKEFKSALLETPEDMDAKENYIYAKLMLEDQQNRQDPQPQQNDENNNDNKDDQENQPQPQPQGNDNQEEAQPQQQKMSPQQAQQILKAIQAKEKETQDKVDKEKAEALKSRQKDKNW